MGEIKELRAKVDSQWAMIQKQLQINFWLNAELRRGVGPVKKRLAALIKACQLAAEVAHSHKWSIADDLDLAVAKADAYVAPKRTKAGLKPAR